MSNARRRYLQEIEELGHAVRPDIIGSGFYQNNPLGMAVLRRGTIITGLIMLETFVRDRTEEVLKELQHWPAEFEDLPDKFRRRATIEALRHIEKFANMLSRQDNDYESAILEEVRQMAAMSPPNFQFTKFIAGDYTGNLSVSGTEDLLRVFQVADCWNTFRSLCADIGFGIPSVKEILASIIRNRHRSAHTSGFSPATNDIVDLPGNLKLIGVCFDSALSCSLQVALHHWERWACRDFDWRKRLDIYFVDAFGPRFRLIRKGSKRATRIVDDISEAKRHLPNPHSSVTRLLVSRGGDGRPNEWDIQWR